ncbi:plasmid stability protein [Paraburkholderia aromaticivorans]|uniref:plasmid stability protein n=1 Tax=Paraburkholderia aromaticivorans TaxID=2026199 RepID=UPI001980E2DD|nr:plasmid stability protein [Paraburkholderia aromaticivorans]
MEEEARDILRSALAVEPPQGDTLVESIRRRIVSFGGVELDLPACEAIRDPDGFSA